MPGSLGARREGSQQPFDEAQLQLSLAILMKPSLVAGNFQVPSRSRAKIPKGSRPGGELFPRFWLSSSQLSGLREPEDDGIQEWEQRQLKLKNWKDFFLILPQPPSWLGCTSFKCSEMCSGLKVSRLVGKTSPAVE